MAKIINYGQPIGAGTTVIPDNQVALEIESTDAKDFIRLDTSDGAEEILIGGVGAGIKVGVGSDTPNANFTVRSSGTNAKILELESALDGTLLRIEDRDANVELTMYGTGGSAQHKLHTKPGADGVIFNDIGEDVDFRVESDSQTHMLFVDASADAIGVNQSSPDAPLHIVGVGGDTGMSWSTGAGSPTMILENADPGGGDTKDRCALAINGDGGSGGRVELYYQDTRKLVLGGASTSKLDAENGALAVGTTGAHDVTIKTANTTRMSIASDGVVSIDSTEEPITIGGSLGGKISFARAGGVAISAAHASGSLYFQTGGGANRAHLTTTGYFGVGDLSPTSMIGIKGNLATALSSGTVSTSGSSTTLSGGSTAFLTDFAVGSAIKVGSVTTTVTAIASNTSLTLEDAIETGVTGTTCTRDPDLFQVKTGDGKISLYLPSGSATTTLIGTGTGVSKDVVGVTSAGALAGHGVGGVQCSFFGYKAGLLGSGNYSTIIGSEAMKASTDAGGGSHAQQNTALGYNAGATLTTAKDCTIIGSGANGIAAGDNQVAIGRSATCTAGDQVRLGNTDITDIDGEVALTATSDQRVKTNVEDLAIGLEFINALRPVSFTRIHPSEWPEEIREQRYMEGQVVTGSDGAPEIISTSTFDVETQQPIKGDFDDTKRSDGLLAQEVLTACENLGATFNGIKERPDGKLGIQYSLLVAPLIKAVQELTARIEELENGE